MGCTGGKKEGSADSFTWPFTQHDQIIDHNVTPPLLLHPAPPRALRYRLTDTTGSLTAAAGRCATSSTSTAPSPALARLWQCSLTPALHLTRSRRFGTG